MKTAFGWNRKRKSMITCVATHKLWGESLYTEIDKNKNLVNVNTLYYLRKINNRYEFVEV